MKDKTFARISFELAKICQCWFCRGCLLFQLEWASAKLSKLHTISFFLLAILEMSHKLLYTPLTQLCLHRQGWRRLFQLYRNFHLFCRRWPRAFAVARILGWAIIFDLTTKVSLPEIRPLFLTVINQVFCALVSEKRRFFLSNFGLHKMHLTLLNPLQSAQLNVILSCSSGHRRCWLSGGRRLLFAFLLVQLSDSWLLSSFYLVLFFNSQCAR